MGCHGEPQPQSQNKGMLEMDIYQNLYPDVFRVRCDFLKGSGLQKKLLNMDF